MSKRSLRASLPPVPLVQRSNLPVQVLRSNYEMTTTLPRTRWLSSSMHYNWIRLPAVTRGNPGEFCTCCFRSGPSIHHIVVISTSFRVSLILGDSGGDRFLMILIDLLNQRSFVATKEESKGLVDGTLDRWKKRPEYWQPDPVKLFSALAKR